MTVGLELTVRAKESVLGGPPGEVCAIPVRILPINILFVPSTALPKLPVASSI